MKSIFLVCLVFTCSAVAAAAQGAPEPTSPPRAPLVLPDSQPELQQSKMDIDRKLSLLQSQLAAWKYVIPTLTYAKSSVTAVVSPTSEDWQKLSNLVTAKNMVAAKIQAQQIYSQYGPLFRRYLSPQSQIYDPDVAAAVNDWQNQLTQQTDPLGVAFDTLYDLAYGPQGTYGSQGAPAKELTPTPQIISELRQKLSTEAFDKCKSGVLNVLDSALQSATSQRDTLTKQQADLQRQADEIAAKISKGRLEINQLAIELGLPLFCGTVLLMLSIPIVIQSFSQAAGSSEQVRAIFSSGILVEIITVLLLTMSILILGLANRIEGPVLGTLLGGISGYVLNRFRGRSRVPQDGEEDEADGSGSKDQKKPNPNAKIKVKPNEEEADIFEPKAETGTIPSATPEAPGDKVKKISAASDSRPDPIQGR